MGIGRGMKVGKEEIVGLLAAVERFMTLNHDAEWQTWEARTSQIIAEPSKVPGVAVRREVPEIANHFPQVVVEWSRWHCRCRPQTRSSAGSGMATRGSPCCPKGPTGCGSSSSPCATTNTSSSRNESARSSRGA